MLKKLIKAFGNRYVQAICRREYQTQEFNPNERAVELAFLFRHLARLAPHTVLDVGTGLTPTPSAIRLCGFEVTAIDNVKDYWPKGIANRHFHVLDEDVTQTRLNRKFDFIACISTLEHIDKHDDAIRSMARLLNPGGHIVLTLPYNEQQYVSNVYDLPDSSAHDAGYGFSTQAYSHKEVQQWLADTGLRLMEQEYWQFFTGPYWTVGTQLKVPRLSSPNELHQLSCLLLQAP